LSIQEEDANKAGELGFMAWILTQATLPHKKTKELIFQRKNGSITITMKADPDEGLPYGSIPRLLLAWITKPSNGATI
jgi:hypothetical protein